MSFFRSTLQCTHFLYFLLLFICPVVIVNGFRYYLAGRRPARFPPGPTTLPIIGNLHQFPKTKAFLKFHEWGKVYGSIIGLKLGPQNVVILNDYRHVQTLFDRRGGIYSDRPPNHIANDWIYPRQTHILFAPYGDSWRILRKTLQGLLNVKAVDEILPIQAAESSHTMKQILDDSERWYDHIRRYSTAVILAAVYGLRGATFDSPRVQAMYHVQDQLTQITEIGATPPVDVFPFLKLLPDMFSPWRRWAQNIRQEQQELFLRLVKESKDGMNDQHEMSCFLHRMLQDQQKSGLDDEHIAYLASTLMEAGSDTTASTLLSFLLAMIQHPEVLRKCHEEVDSVCGTDRTPGIEDIGNLPYLKAVMNETLRWRPVAAGGIPHALTQDDEYEGYLFPKGTIFFANAWTIHRTEEYADPEHFHPERFIGNNYGIRDVNSNVEDDKRRFQYGFGAGRRVCSGQRLAENSLIVNMSKIVWAFDLEPGSGRIDDSVDTGYFGGFLIAPKHFPLSIKPRSPKHAAVLTEEAARADIYLSRFRD